MPLIRHICHSFGVHHATHTTYTPLMSRTTCHSHNTHVPQSRYVCRGRRARRTGTSATTGRSTRPARGRRRTSTRRRPCTACRWPRPCACPPTGTPCAWRTAVSRSKVRLIRSELSHWGHMSWHVWTKFSSHSETFSWIRQLFGYATATLDGEDSSSRYHDISSCLIDEKTQ